MATDTGCAAVAEPTPVPRRPAPPPPKPSPLAVVTAALGIFLIALTLLAIQVRNGRDPALGPGPVVAPAAQPATAAGGKAAPTGAKIVTRTSPHIP